MTWTSTRWALVAVLPLAAAALSITSAVAAPGPGPCQGIIVIGCPPQGQPPQQLQPGPSPQPSPTAQPSPGAPAPVPGGTTIPTDVGWGALQNKIYAGGGWLAPQVYQTLIQKPASYDWFLPVYHRMEDIAALLLILFFVLGIISAIINRDHMQLLVVPAGYLPVSIGITVLAIVLTQALIAMTDAFTNYMLQGIGDHAQAGLTNLGALLTAGAAGAAFAGAMSSVALAASSILILGLIGLLIELLLRELVIYGCLLFVPITAAAMIWPRLRNLITVLAEVLIGVILLKFVVAALLVMGFAALSASPFSMGPAGDPGFVSILMGLAVILMALVLGPAALLKMIPFAKGQAAASWSGGARKWAAGKLSPGSLKNFHRSVMQRFAGGAAKALPVAGAAAAAVGASAGGGRGGTFNIPSGSRILVLPPKVAGKPSGGSTQAPSAATGRRGSGQSGRLGAGLGGRVVPSGEQSSSSPKPPKGATSPPASPSPSTRAPQSPRTPTRPMPPPNTPIPRDDLPSPPSKGT